MDCSTDSKDSLAFLNLPRELVDNILSYMTYDEVSSTRLVCISRIVGCASENRGR